MPVDTVHPDYKAFAPKVRRMRDVMAGQDAVHDAGTDYLPKLQDQTADEYAAYVKRATWFGATSRTAEALHGLVFRKPSTIEQTGLDDILADVTMTGRPFDSFAPEVLDEVMTTGRAGVLVDFPSVVEAPSSIGAAQTSGVRPFASLYTFESILNWRTERIANRMMLTLMVLAETYEERADEFTAEEKSQIRVLRLDGVYVQEVWREGASGWEIKESTTPLMNGRPMPFIPFVLCGAQDVGPEVTKPPLLDMADLNLSHYRTTADLEHGAHFTGLPMLMLSGVNLDDGEEVRLGSQKAVVAPDPSAKGAFIEFTGQGLGSLEKLIDRKEQQMAALGASMLTPQRKAVESAQTHEMRSGQETSMLADIANTVSRALTIALEWLRDWSGASGDVRVQLNTDYVVSAMTAQDLTALVAAWQSGAISRATFFWNLQQGEMVPDGKTVEEETAEIDAEGPPLGMTEPEGGDAAR